MDGPYPSSLCPSSSSLLLLYLSPTSLFLGMSFLVVVVSPFLLGVSSSSSCCPILHCCCTPHSSSCHFPPLSWVQCPACVANGLYSLGLGGWGVLSWHCQIPRTDIGPASLSSNLSPWSNSSPLLNLSLLLNLSRNGRGIEFGISEGEEEGKTKMNHDFVVVRFS